MIGKIKGVLSEIHGDEALMETSGGVFYRLFITRDIVQNFLKGEEIQLYTFLQVKDDDFVLYGFRTRENYLIFKLLISVDGVGPKVAFTIMNAQSADQIKEAVAKSDVDFFERIKGIGKKTAQRILVDLSGKFGEEVDFAHIQESPEDIDALDALVSLGFKRMDARRVLSHFDKNIKLEDKIKQAIQTLSQKTRDHE